MTSRRTERALLPGGCTLPRARHERGPDLAVVLLGAYLGRLVEPGLIRHMREGDAKKRLSRAASSVPPTRKQLAGQVQRGTRPGPGFAQKQEEVSLERHVSDRRGSLEHHRTGPLVGKPGPYGPLITEAALSRKVADHASGSQRLDQCPV